MKKLGIILLSLLCASNLFSQSDDNTSVSGFSLGEAEKTAALELLYEQAHVLEENGTAAEIEANRLAIKAAWEQVNPEVAALYKPVYTGVQYKTVGFNGVPYVPTEIVERPEIVPHRDWTTDLLLRDDFIDGIDIEVANNGDIYVAAYENEIDAGGSLDHLYIYKSTDHGASFTLWKDEPAVSPFRKIQLVILSGAGEEYLIAYSLFEGGLFEALRWDLQTASLSLEIIVPSGVSDFSVDRNYPGTTNTQRVFATYQLDNLFSEVFSARSTAGSYGLGWVDEVSTSNTFGLQVDFAYGRSGACYVTYTGFNTGNLYANVNPDYNDPASWGTRETVELGGNEETVNPSIAAARKLLPADEIVIFTSSIPTGSPLGYNIKYYIRENSSDYSVLWTGLALPGDTNVHYDTWIRRTNNVDQIRAAYVRSIVDNSIDDRLIYRDYDGVAISGPTLINDTGNEVWNGFAPAVAESLDQLPCIAFAGNVGGNAYGLYFDNEAGVVLDVTENRIVGLSYYPNPTKNELHIQAKTMIDEIIVYSVLGQKVIHVQPQEYQSTISTAGLTSGIYLVEVKSNSTQSIFKIIKE